MTTPHSTLTPPIEEMAQLFAKYVTFTDSRHPLVCALWCAQTWLFQTTGMHGLETVGYLAFASPVENCGKTNALRTTSAMSYGSPSLDITPSPATLYRSIGEKHETVIFDELDGLDEESDIIAVLNAGYKRGAKVKRMGGRDRDKLLEFETFCPKAIAYIRDSKSLRAIKRTLEGRCIRILLKRRTDAENRVAPRLRERQLVKEAAPLVDLLARWAFSVPNDLSYLFDKVAVADMQGREQEVWENILVVAELAGCLKEAQDAAWAVVLANREEVEDHTSTDTPLFQDIQKHIREMCDEEGFSLELASAWLCQMYDRGWAKAGAKGEGLTPQALGRILSKYGLRSRKCGITRVRRIPKGAVLDVLERHLPVGEER